MYMSMGVGFVLTHKWLKHAKCVGVYIFSCLFTITRTLFFSDCVDFPSLDFCTILKDLETDS